MSLFYNLNESKATENVTMKWPSDEYIIPAGTPMSRTGIANNGDAIGILAREARIEFPYPLSIAHLIGKKEPKGNQDFTFTLITGGYVNLEEVEAAFGGEISEEAKAAMSDIVFVKKNIDLGGGGSGGGSAEIPTCTVKFVVGTNGEYYGNHSYTKCVNGVISTEKVFDWNYEVKGEGTEITLENVVCDSIIYFAWAYNWDASAGNIWVDGDVELLEMRNSSINETCLFKAQSEPNSVSTITVVGEWIDESGGFEE